MTPLMAAPENEWGHFVLRVSYTDELAMWANGKDGKLTFLQRHRTEARSEGI